MPVTFSSYRLGPGQRASNKTVPPPWDWLLRRENELGPRRSRSQITFAVLVPPLYVAVQAPGLIVTLSSLNFLVPRICSSTSLKRLLQETKIFYLTFSNQDIAEKSACAQFFCNILGDPKSACNFDLFVTLVEHA